VVIFNNWSTNISAFMVFAIVIIIATTIT
jgi:hypothetical protein